VRFSHGRPARGSKRKTLAEDNNGGGFIGSSGFEVAMVRRRRRRDDGVLIRRAETDSTGDLNRIERDERRGW